MNKKIFNYLEMAGEFAVSKDDKRNFLLGAIGIRSDGRMVKAINGPTEFPNRSAHAECRLAGKLDKGAVVYVARIRLDNHCFGNSKPCHDCMKVLKSKRVRKIYYTISDNSFGVINMD